MKPGIFQQTDEQYHEGGDAPCLSSSICKILCSSSPLHAWTAHSRLNPNFVRKEKEIFDLGTVAHALMLQGIESGHIIQTTKKEGKGKNRVDTGVPVTDYKTKEAKEERDAARAAGKSPILSYQWETVKAMVEAGRQQLANHKEASDAFTDGTAETTLLWFDEEFGVWCKARLDWLKSDRRRIFDYKSTGTSVNPETIANYAISQGWDIQGAFYLRGLRQITGHEADFIFIAQEYFEPYALAAVGLGPDFLWNGNSKVERALGVWAECLQTNSWPGYTQRIVYPVLPAWEEERSVRKELDGSPA